MHGDANIIMMASSFWSRNPSQTARGRKIAHRPINFRKEAAAVGFSFATALRPSKDAPMEISASGEAIVPRFWMALWNICGGAIWK